VIAALVLLVLLPFAAGCGSGTPQSAPGTTEAPQDAFGIIGAAPSTATVAARFVIPAGTAERLDSGLPVNILPSKLHYRVGQVIQVINQDSRGETVGPFIVGPMATVTEKFATPGRYAGVCTVHPGGKIEIDVSA
jgi:plastocyanin